MESENESIIYDDEYRFVKQIISLFNAQFGDGGFDQDGYFIPNQHPFKISRRLDHYQRNGCGCIIYSPNMELKFKLPTNFNQSDWEIEYKWVKYEKSIPKNAVIVGLECTGCSIYACRVEHEGEIIPAKLESDETKAWFSYGCREVQSEKFEILCGPVVKWVRMENGNVPEDAIPVGNTSTAEKLYMGRAPFLNTLTPGKIHPSHECLYISRDGKEIIIKEYEVMCVDTEREKKIRKAVNVISNFWLKVMYSPNSKYVTDVIKPRFNTMLNNFSS